MTRFDEEMEVVELEANRLLAAIEEHKQAIHARDSFKKKGPYDYPPATNASRAAVRRSSLDLTRALAKMRKGFA